MRILLTGATGFAGQHFVEYLLNNTDWEIFVLRRLTCRRLSDAFQNPRVHAIYHDFTAEIPDRILHNLSVDYIVHMGAEVHGIRSLEDPELFVRANALGTFNMLEAARKLKPQHFVYISSAEAVGATDGAALAEDAPLRPSNPYSAAKAAGEALVLSYGKSFDVPASIVRTMNLFGPRQDTSKFVPATIKKILNGERVINHIGKNGRSGSRCWLHVHSFIADLFGVLLRKPDIYHIAGPERDNVQIIDRLALALHLPVRIHSEIPGKSHDMRYAICSAKLKSSYEVVSLDIDLTATARWYKQNPEWLG